MDRSTVIRSVAELVVVAGSPRELAELVSEFETAVSDADVLRGDNEEWLCLTLWAAVGVVSTALAGDPERTQCLDALCATVVSTCFRTDQEAEVFYELLAKRFDHYDQAESLPDPALGPDLAALAYIFGTKDFAVVPLLRRHIMAVRVGTKEYADHLKVEAASPVSLPRYDPMRTGAFNRGTPATFVARITTRCAGCGGETAHDVWEAILGFHVGFALPIGRKSTAGKLGKKSRWAFCAACGDWRPADDAAVEGLRTMHCPNRLT